MSLNMDAPGPETFGINTLMDCINFANKQDLEERIIDSERWLNQNLNELIIYSRIKQQQPFINDNLTSQVLNRNFKNSLVNKIINQN